MNKSKQEWVAKGKQFQIPDKHKKSDISLSSVSTDREWFDSIWDASSARIDGFVYLCSSKKTG